MISIRYVGRREHSPNQGRVSQWFHIMGSVQMILVGKPSLSSALDYPNPYCLSWARRSTKAMPTEFRGYVEYCIGLALTPVTIYADSRNQVSSDHPERQASSHLRRCIHSIVRWPWKRGHFVVAEKLVRHETPAWCRQTARADEYDNFNICTEFLHGDVYIYHKLLVGFPSDH
jgi:hypothetical protein